MLLVPAGVATTPEPPTPTPEPAGPGDLRATWTAPDGTEVELTNPDLGWVTDRAATGWGAAPITIVTDPHPRGGVSVRHIQPDARFITWPLEVFGATHLDFTSLWRYIMSLFTMTRRRGPGVLRVFRPDGTAREIEAYYQAGFAGTAGQGHTFDTAVMTLLCPDPYWRDAEATEPPPWDYEAAPADFLDPYPTVSSGQSVNGDSTVTNPGDVEAWPVWTVTGPMTSLEAENTTTGESFTLTGTLVDDTETVVIDTYAGTVTGPDGSSWFGNLDLPGAVLWGLDPGVNEITLAMAGANTGSQIAMRWRSRWESA